MPAAQQYRAKAAVYAALAKTAPSASECREFSALERNFISLAANEDWLAEDPNRAVAPVAADQAQAQDDHILRALGAAVVMRWHTLPKKIQRELLDHADSIADEQPMTELKERLRSPIIATTRGGRPTG
jgi:hypothetical protein